MLAAVESKSSLALPLASVLRRLHDFRGMRAALEHVGHARAVGAHEALELGETSLDLLELGWVEVDLVRVVAQLGGDVLDVDEGALERVGVLGEGSVEGRCLPQHAHGLRETVGHAVIA